MQTVRILSRKFVRLLSGGYSAMQILQRINRSPLRHAVKLAATLADLPAKNRRRRYARALSAPDGATALRRSGICYPAIAPVLARELADAARALRQAVGEEHRRANKTYLKAFIAADLEAGRIDNRSIFVRFAAQPSVVDLLAAYFGEAPYLSYVALDLSEYAGETLTTSQLWHRDHDDTKVVKLFAYNTDVSCDADGPFTFIPPQPSRRIRGVASAHLPDAQLLAQLAGASPVKVTAPAGAAFLVDTGRCYHMGSRVGPGKSRVMYTACYVTRPAIYPNFLNKIATREPLTERERLLLLP